MQTEGISSVQLQVLEAQSQSTNARLNSKLSVAESASKTELRKAAEDFEAVFLSQMLQPMFETLPEGGMLSGGNAEKIYQGMMVNEVGKSLAKNGGIGVADQVYRELLKLQEQ